MDRMARLTMAVISSTRSEPPNFHRRLPPTNRARMAPPAQKVRLRRYQTGTLRFGALSRDSLVGDDPGCARGDPGCVWGEPGCVIPGCWLGDSGEGISGV